MSIEAMRLALDALEDVVCYGTGESWMTEDCENAITSLRLAIAQAQWKGLTDEEAKPFIQRAMQHFGFDPTQYSLSGAATIGLLRLAREIEAKLKEKNCVHDR